MFRQLGSNSTFNEIKIGHYFYYEGGYYQKISPCLALNTKNKMIRTLHQKFTVQKFEEIEGHGLKD